MVSAVGGAVGGAVVMLILALILIRISSSAGSSSAVGRAGFTARRRVHEKPTNFSTRFAASQSRRYAGQYYV